MRFYDVAAASLAIDAPVKWTDNLLSQHHIQGVVSAARGVARRIPRPALLRIAVIRKLHTQAGIGVADCVRLADAIVTSETHSVRLPGHVTITIDRDTIERELDDRLRDVLESAPTPRRGRPPLRRA